MMYHYCYYTIVVSFILILTIVYIPLTTSLSLSSTTTTASSIPINRIKKKVIHNHISTRRTCDVCKLEFKRIDDYNRHINGKRHNETVSRATPVDMMWNEFIGNATSWSKGCSIDDIKDIWTDDELDTLGLKYRETCLHPSPMVSDLKPYQRARIWRYVRDALGLGYYSELASIIANVDSDSEGSIRVKELFESIETVKLIEKFVIASNKTISSDTDSRKINAMYDLACGHAMIGILLAYRFPSIQIYCYDISKRNAFNIFIKYFELYGYKHPGCDRVLPNVHFIESDMMDCKEHVTNTSLVVMIHGCNELNDKAINIALDSNACYFVMPCCIRKGMYLDNCNVFRIDDNSRFHVLLGAMANKYQAQSLLNIDGRITNRNCILAGGVVTSNHCSSDHDNNTDDGSGSSRNMLSMSLKRKNMPPLNYS